MSLEPSWCYKTSDIRNVVDTFWPQFWNLWLWRGGGRLRQVVDKLMTTSEHVLLCGPISPGGNYRSRGSQDDAMFRAQDSAPEFIISFVYNAVFVTGETCFHPCGVYLEWKWTCWSDVMKTKNSYSKIQDTILNLMIRILSFLFWLFQLAGKLNVFTLSMLLIHVSIMWQFLHIFCLRNFSGF